MCIRDRDTACAPAVPARSEEASAPVPEQIDINELRERPLNDLQEMAERLPIRNAASLTKSQLIFELGKQLLAQGHEVVVSGVMEQAKEDVYKRQGLRLTKIGEAIADLVQELNVKGLSLIHI